MTKKLPLFILCWGAFLNWVSFGLIYPIFALTLFGEEPLFLSGSSDALRGVLLGLLLGATPIGQFIAAPFIGALSDQRGRRPVLQWTYLLIALGYVLCMMGIWLSSFFLVIFGRLVTGIGAGNIAAINSSVADLSLSHEKTKNFALITMANGIGFTMGPFLGGKLAVWGFAVPFIAAAVLSVVMWLCFTLFFEETYRKKEEDRSHFLSRLQHLLKMASLPKVRIFFLGFFLFCFGWSYYWEFIPVTWIKNFGLNASQIGNFYAYGSLFYVLTTGLLIRPIVKIFKPLSILIFSLVMLGVTFWGLYFSHHVGMYWVGIALQQFFVAIIFPVGTAMVSDMASESRQGEILGAFQSLQAFAFAATPFLGGIFLDLSYNIPLMMGGISMFLACLIFIVRRRKV